MKKIYLSGPMTGIKDLNRPLFNREAAKLRRAGYVVINPPELDDFEPEPTWETCLRRDLRILVDQCDRVATLPNWKKSRGANLEIHVARALSMPVHSVRYYLKRRKSK